MGHFQTGKKNTSKQEKKHLQTGKTPPNKEKTPPNRKKHLQTRKNTSKQEKNTSKQEKHLSSKGYLPIKCKSLQVVGVSGQGKAVASDGG